MKTIQISDEAYESFVLLKKRIPKDVLSKVVDLDGDINSIIFTRGVFSIIGDAEETTMTTVKLDMLHRNVNIKGDNMVDIASAYNEIFQEMTKIGEGLNLSNITIQFN